MTTIHTKHDRNLLSIHSIEAFANFARSVGAGVRPGKGDFQLLQVKTTGPEWHAICKNSQGTITTAPVLRPLIQRFKENKPVAPVRKAPATPSAAQYAADFRDDAAIEFMGSLMLKVQAPTEMTDEQMLALAKTAYRMADALLIAGDMA